MVEVALRNLHRICQLLVLTSRSELLRTLIRRKARPTARRVGSSARPRAFLRQALGEQLDDAAIDEVLVETAEYSAQVEDVA
jgi:hypothetical protein